MNDFQARFNEKGVGVQYSMVQWYVHHGQSGHMEFRYWLEFSDVAVAGVYVAENAFQPDRDYSKITYDEKEKSMDKEVLSGASHKNLFQTVQGAPITDGSSFDIVGTWEYDAAQSTGTSIMKSSTTTITLNGAVYVASSTTKLKWYMPVGTITSSMPITCTAPNHYTYRDGGKQYYVTVTSATTMTIEHQNRLIAFVKVDAGAGKVDKA